MRHCIRGWPASGTLRANGRQRTMGDLRRIAHYPSGRKANLSNSVICFDKSCQSDADLSHLLPHSAAQRHHHDDGGCGGQRRQPYVGQHVETPPPQFSSRIPGSQSIGIIPHAGDATGTILQENQVKRFVTVRLVRPAVGILDGRRKSGPGFRRHVLLVQPGSDGVRIISNDVPRHEAVDRFLNVLS